MRSLTGEEGYLLRYTALKTKKECALRGTLLNNNNLPGIFMYRLCDSGSAFGSVCRCFFIKRIFPYVGGQNILFKHPHCIGQKDSGCVGRFGDERDGAVFFDGREQRRCGSAKAQDTRVRYMAVLPGVFQLLCGDGEQDATERTADTTIGNLAGF